LNINHLSAAFRDKHFTNQFEVLLQNPYSGATNIYKKKNLFTSKYLKENSNFP